jgi:glycosyltransferase involved in cell wall biosynthesis
VTVAAQLFWATSRWQMRSMLFVHDFFPHHHRSIGLVPGGPVFDVARRLEENLIRKFHVIGCIWPDNIVYLKKHYRIRADQHVIWTPLWGEITPPPTRPRDAIRSEHALPLERKILVFGGQITEGRGVEEMLAAATLAQEARPDLAFLLIGEGRLVELVESHIASGGDNVIYRRRVPRSQYLSLISACDIGIVCTVAGVDSSSFPSKTIDYLRAGLPIVAAVERDSDYREFLRRWNIGASIPAGDATALFRAVTRMIDDREVTANITRNARACLEEVFDVRPAVKRLLDEIDSNPPQ